jgi:Tfp pilus assembly protein PilF
MTIKPQRLKKAQINSVIELYSNGQIQEALDTAGALIKDYPNEAILYNISGACYASLGQLDTAVKRYEKALDIKPDYADAHNNLAITLQKLGQLDEAVKSYEQALVIRPDYAEAFNNLGIVLKELGQLDTAVKSYERILAIKPDFAEAHYNLGITLQELGQLDAAVKSYEQALVIRPDYAEAHYNLDFTLQALRQLDEAFQQKCIGKATEKQKIVEFLELVKPIKTNHDLIRVGGDTDGGYLIPNDIENIDTCFSPGVSEVANFENDLTKRGIKCFLADYSVEKPPIKNTLFDFEKKYLGAKNNEMFMTLESWIKSKAPNKNDFILQMDIEGMEYSVIFDTSSETLDKFRILVIEFHRLDSLPNRMRFDLIDLAFKKILKNFEVVHIHPNNYCKPIEFNGITIPPHMEFTFLRKDRITQKGKNLSFPHKLDRANVAQYADFALPKCWY